MTQHKRRCLPDRRKSVTFKPRLAGQAVFITVGLYDDGSPGEVFVVLSKCGSTLRGVLDSWARQVSMSLQWGQPLADIIDSFLWVQFEPSGVVTGHPDVVRSTSVIDLVVRVLALEFLGMRHLANAPMEAAETISDESLPKVLRTREGNEGRIETAPEPDPMAAAFQAATLASQRSTEARLKGFTGEACQQCKGFNVVMDGKCAKCQDCGFAAGGCS